MNRDATGVNVPSDQDFSREAKPGETENRNLPVPGAIRFEDIFSLADMQRIQDAFAEAANVASCITDPTGRPLTRPSRFTSLCRDVIRATDRGMAACDQWHRQLAQPSKDGPRVATCPSGGLLTGSTSIFFGERHIATWFIGQVVDEGDDIEAILAHGRDLGADPESFGKALELAPRLPRERFEKICQALYWFANHFSDLARTNHQLSRRIRELHRAEARILARDKYLADLIDFLPDPTMVLDADGKVVFWNRALEKLSGVAAADILGKGDFAYGQPFYGAPTPILVDYARGAVTKPAPRYAVAEIGEDAIIAAVTAVSLPGGARHLWAKAVALRDEEGRIVGSIETIRDVTDRHQTEMALRESEEKFRRIVETAHEGVLVVDPDFRITFANRRLADMLGLAPEDLLGRDMEAFVAEDQRAEVLERKDSLRRGKSAVYELRLKTRQGRDLWALVSASPLYDASGASLGSLGMLTDITARKRIEEELANHRLRLEAEVEERTSDLRRQALELAEANIRLSELDRLKSAFLSTVSHELRTPLTSILGFAKLIGREFTERFLPLASGNPTIEPKGRRIADNLRVIYNEAERLTRLINDVLDLNRIESGRMDWRDRRIAPVEVLCTAAKGIEGLLGERPEITFSFTAEDQVPDLLMDPDQLVQVVSNLLQNAIKFTRAGQVRMTVGREGDAVRIVVSDTGIGIPATELESIFGNFHQVGRGDTLADTVKGTGLGLAICRQIVHHYGGRIWATSTLGQGSAFHVLLPCLSGKEPVKTPDAATCGEKR